MPTKRKVPKLTDAQVEQLLKNSELDQKEPTLIMVGLKTINDWQDLLAAMQFAVNNMPFQMSDDGSTSNKETIARLIREVFKQVSNQPPPGEQE